jgi:ABC-type sugar transport system substrate-binding protein
MMGRRLRGLAVAAALVALLGSLAAGSAGAQSVALAPLCPGGTLCGALVLVPEDRFDPWVQRLLAGHELAGQPTRFRPLLIVVPAPPDRALEESQIRYLEQLLQPSAPQE